MIICCSGPQRSGKTLMASMIAREGQRAGMEVYTNMETESFVHIDSLKEVPLLDLKPKILLLDEAHSLFNSRSFSNFKEDQSLFFNILGKCNCILIVTTIHPSMIDKVVREQIDYLVLARGDKRTLNYRFIDCILQNYHDLTIEKSELFWKSVEGLYDTQQVPDLISLQLSEKDDSFASRIKEARAKLKNKS